MNYRIVIFLSCALVCNMPGNQLQRVFNHKLVTDDRQMHIELGKIVLYFTQEPIVKQSASKMSATKKGYQEVTYFIPNVAITGDQAQQEVNAINKAAQNHYFAAIRTQQKPNGIEVKISYDPNKVVLQQDSFEAVQHQKAITFHIYNKTLLDAIKQKGQTILRTSDAKKTTIIIDCGHGGHDKGTVGFCETVEKNLTLAIGMQVAQELKKQGLPVLLTRVDDRFVPLDERTLIANRCNGNAILISLHTNNAPRPEVHGLETFCLASHLFTKENNQLETAIDVMIHKQDSQQYARSKQLAQSVHPAILETIHKNGYEMPDRKIRHAATQVLMGIKWPGILIEMEYVSNQKSAAFLKDPQYQEILVQGICRGITDYLKKAQDKSA